MIKGKADLQKFFPSTLLLIMLKCTLTFLPLLSSLNAIISPRAEGVHIGVHKLTPFVWEVQGCRVHCICFYATSSMYKSYHRCVSSAKGHVRKHTVGRGHQSGLTQHGHCIPFKDDLLPIFSHELYPPHNCQQVEVCGVCSNSLTQP